MTLFYAHWLSGRQHCMIWALTDWIMRTPSSPPSSPYFYLSLPRFLSLLLLLPFSFPFVECHSVLNFGSESSEIKQENFFFQSQQFCFLPVSWGQWAPVPLLYLIYNSQSSIHVLLCSGPEQEWRTQRMAVIGCHVDEQTTARRLWVSAYYVVYPGSTYEFDNSTYFSFSVSVVVT